MTSLFVSLPSSGRHDRFPAEESTLLTLDADVLMSRDDREDDGQLHTLGLLEQLRAESSYLWRATADFYFRVDKLLQELANPNLHEINAHMPFRVELWDRHAQHIRWVVAAAGTVHIGHAAFVAAV